MVDCNLADMKSGISIRACRFHHSFQCDALIDYLVKIPQDPKQPTGICLDTRIQENWFFID